MNQGKCALRVTSKSRPVAFVFRNIKGIRFAIWYPFLKKKKEEKKVEKEKREEEEEEERERERERATMAGSEGEEVEGHRGVDVRTYTCKKTSRRNDVVLVAVVAPVILSAGWYVTKKKKKKNQRERERERSVHEAHHIQKTVN